MNRQSPGRESAWGRLALAALLAAACLAPAAAAGRQENGMILIPACRSTVGTSAAERAELAKRFDCHPTWLSDDLPQHDVNLPPFWIDRYPVTNAQYLAFIEATDHRRPSWWRQWDDLFPNEYADHPVAGVSGKDATAYAKWAAKRLPTAEEWEAAAAGQRRSVFAWGDAWPGPLKLPRSDRVSWDLPGTRPVGAGDCGRSAAGIEDFAGQVLEWVADTLPHHGVQFQLMKAASWFHEDPLSFRIASGWYAYEDWQASFTGFRCALDGERTPPRAPQSSPPETLSRAAAMQQLQAAGAGGPPELAAHGGTSRHISIRAPNLGSDIIGLTAPETIIWNGSSVMTWRKTPDITWLARTPQHAAYEMRFADLTVEAEFLAHQESVEQRFTAVNLTGQPGSFTTSSCFNLQSCPMFYDCEQLRTYVYTAEGKFTPIRRLSRGGDCVRWIAGPSAEELGKNPQWVLLAVVSRDNRWIIAAGRAASDAGISVATNTLFTCLHADSTVHVPPGQKASTQQFFWFIEGDLGDLLRRAAQDLKPH